MLISELLEVVLMPGNENSGAGIPFRMPEKELNAAIKKYKQDATDGKFPRPSWPHFCATLGYTEAEVKECIERGQDRQSAYYGRAVALKRVATWVRGEMLSGKGWSGQVQSKAIFALKQDIGDGVSYTDRDVGTASPTKINIQFGGDDPRGKKAGK